MTIKDQKLKKKTESGKQVILEERPARQHTCPSDCSHGSRARTHTNNNAESGVWHRNESHSHEPPTAGPWPPGESFLMPWRQIEDLSVAPKGDAWM